MWFGTHLILLQPYNDRIKRFQRDKNMVQVKAKTKKVQKQHSALNALTGAPSDSYTWSSPTSPTAPIPTPNTSSPETPLHLRGEKSGLLRVWTLVTTLGCSHMSKDKGPNTCGCRGRWMRTGWGSLWVDYREAEGERLNVTQTCMVTELSAWRR